MLHLHHSNRMERLAEGLARLLAEPPEDPFRPETVVVQHPGLARWLEIRLAETLGVCANVRFPLPARFVWEAVRAVLGPEVPEEDPLERGRLALRVFALLPELLGEPPFAPVRRHLGEDPGGRRRWRLAVRVADVLDRYQVYRPELLEAWARGAEPGDWQAALWRALRRGVPATRAELLRRFLERWDAEEARAAGALPPRLAVFGVSSLPPRYLDVLRAVSEVADVHLFFHNPSREWWGEIVSERGRARAAAADADAAAYLESGNALLAALGRQGRDFLWLLHEAETPMVAHEAFEHPAPAAGASLLARVQADILELREGPGPGGDAAVAADDRSIAFHVCHGPMRECQVLRDRLLELFETLPGLEPREVIVMAPDMERYAPYVEAVFGAPGEGPRIPYAISDRVPAASDPLVRWLDGFLALPEGRLTVSEVMGLVGAAPARRRAGLDEEALEAVRAWVVGHGVRWGADAGDRAAAGLPPSALHTWRFGEERLLAGYALPEGQDADVAVYAGRIAPGAGVEGELADTLGRLWRYQERLARWRRELRRERTPAEWEAALTAALDELLEPAGDEEEEGVQHLREAVAGLAEEAEAAGAQVPVALPALRLMLAGRLGEGRAGVRFLGGGVTFCSLAPMRSIPFRVVCLLGMGDADFPRRARRPEFDRMAGHYRRGDRSARDDDRYLFLEALLSAREVLHVSWVGRDPRDDGERQPSVVVGELLDYLDRHYRPAGGEGPLRARLVHVHPLQPFSPARFEEGAPAPSYDGFWLPAARALAVQRAGGAADAGERLPEPPEPLTELGLARLARFLADPAAGYLLERFGASPEGDEPLAHEDDEPFVLDRLAHYRLCERLLAHHERGIPREALEARLRAEGALPAGHAGRAALAEAWAEVERLWRDRVERWWGTPEPPREVRLALEVPGAGPLPVRGVVRGRVHDGALLRYRPGSLRARDVLALWVDHLALCAAGEAREAVFVARDRYCRLPPLAPDEAHARLAALAGLHAEGRRRPLPVLPERVWAAWLGATKGRGKARKARPRAVDETVWRGLAQRLEAEAARGELDVGAAAARLWAAAPQALWGEAAREATRALLDPLLAVAEVSEGRV